MRRYLLPLALAGGLWAQVGTSAKPGSLEGTVANSVTHAPVPKATVSIGAGKAYSYVATTDEAGRFQIANVEPGSYHVEYIRAENYAYRVPPGSMPAPITMGEEQRVTGIAIEMLPLAAIAGKVVDDAGEPLLGAQVSVMAFDYSDGLKTLQTVNGATTDDRGEYRVFHLNPGSYFVHAWMAPEGLPNGSRRAPPLPPNVHRNTVEMGYEPVFYPNGSEVSQATATRVPPGGEVVGINFRLHTVPLFHIRGVIEDAPPDSGFTVLAAACESSGASTGATRYSAIVRDGRFDISAIRSGVWCLSLDNPGRGERVYGSETVTVGNRNLDGIKLAARLRFRVPGRVEFEGLRGDAPSVTFRLQGASVIPPSQGDGQFTLFGIQAGAYRIDSLVVAPPNWYLKSMRYGTEDVSDGPIQLREGGAVLTLVLAGDAGQMSGTVQTSSGEPAAGRPVTIAPEYLSKRRDLFHTVRTDAAGHFQATGLAPGEYKIYAWDDPDVPMAGDAGFRAAFSTQPTAVTINSGATATVQLKVIPAEAIRQVKEKY